MATNRNVYAVILSAGCGSRFCSKLPKQYHKVKGRMVIEHTIERFASHPLITGVLVVIDSRYEFYYQDMHFDIPHLVCYGGATGQESFHNALKFLQTEVGLKANDIVVEHDGDRPLVDERIITDVVNSCIKYGNGCTGILSTDYVMKGSNDIISYGDHSRQQIRTQTPHAFLFGDIKDVYDEAEEMGFSNIIAPCDIFGLYKKDLHLVKGSTANGIKLVTKEDLEIIKKLI